jgi:hypothetical protein
VISHEKSKSGLSIGTKQIKFYDVSGKNIITSNVNADVFGTESTYVDRDDGYERSYFFKKGNWNHLVVTYSGDALREYVNGTLTDVSTCDFGLIGNGKKLTLGAQDDGFKFIGFQGDIANVSIWNYVISQEEIAELRKQPDE